MAQAGDIKITLRLDGDNAVVKGIERITESADKARNSFSGWRGAAADFAHVATAVGALGFAFTNVAGNIGSAYSALSNAAVASDKLANTLRFATGSAGAAAASYDSIVGIANRLGLSLDTAGAAFAKLQAAAVGTSLAGAGAKKIFEAVASASTVMGLSGEETSGALLAISQMMSKGTVSAEELRGQLGERLPGAFQIAARAMGVTTSEFDKLLSTGKVVAEDFLPKFAAELTRTLGDAPESAARSAQAQINRLSTEWDLFKRNVADTSVFRSTMAVVAGIPAAMMRAMRSASTDEKVAAQFELIDQYKQQGYSDARTTGPIAEARREIARLQDEKRRLASAGAARAESDTSYDDKEARRAAITGVAPRAEDVDAWEKFNTKLRTSAEKTSALIKEARALALAAGADPAEAISRINQAAADKGGKGSKGSTDDGQRAQLREMNDAAAEELERIRDQTRLDHEAARARQVMTHTVDGLTDAYVRQNAVADERGMATAERELAAALRQVEEQADRAREALSQKAASLNTDNLPALAAFRQAVVDVSQAEAAQAAQVRRLHEERLRQNDDWKTGLNDALLRYQGSALNVAQTAEAAFTKSFSGMEDALANFAATGKLSFSSLATSIVADIARIQARAAISGLLGVVQKSFNPGGSEATISAGSSTIFGPPMPQALGGVFASPSLHQYVNQVHDQPRLFQFASGGVFGEAGPEAIMPLRRDASGRLGVSAAASASPVSVEIHNYSGQPATQREVPDGRGGRRLEVTIGDLVASEIRRPGSATQSALRTPQMTRR